MSIGPEDLERAVFKERFRGYDQDEVDRLLDVAAAGIAELRAERDRLAAEVEELRAGGVLPGAVSPGEVDPLLKRTLAAAQRTAEELVAEARREAKRTVEEARALAARERELVQAEVETMRRAIGELRGFRDEYRARLHAVMSEQLAALDRAGELPRLPPMVEQVVDGPRRVEAQADPTPAQAWAEAASAEPESDAPQVPSDAEAAPWDEVWGGEAWGPREERAPRDEAAPIPPDTPPDETPEALPQAPPGWGERAGDA